VNGKASVVNSWTDLRPFNYTIKRRSYNIKWKEGEKQKRGVG